MKKIIIGLVIVAVVAAGAYVVWGRGLQAGTSGGAQPTPTMPAVRADSRIVADAKVVPARNARLSMPASGIVAEVLMDEGQQVEAGQVMLKLESSRQAAAVSQAEAGLQAAQANLAGLKAGARDEERRSAQAAMDAAQAHLDRVKGGPQPAEVTAAQATLAEAQAALRKIQEGTDQQQIIAAEAEYLNAAAAVRGAQAAYDLVRGDPNIGARPEALQLEQATHQFDAAGARLEELKKGASTADIAGARARVQRAQAQLDLLTQTNPADVAGAEAEVRRAQAQLDLLGAGSRPESIAAAEAEVAAAEATLEQARVALGETELKAPFAGAIAALNVQVGEQVGPTSTVVQLADLSSLQIETDDLTELNVVHVREGAPVTITFDAIPDLNVTGKVVRIKPLGENKQGDMTYTVVIRPDNLDPRLRWNMTATVSIEPE